MKLWKRISITISIMLTISMLLSIGMLTVMADDSGSDTGSTLLDAPEKAWWSSSTMARWKSVKNAKQYQVKLYEAGGLESAVTTIKVTANSYDFSEVMQDGKQYCFMVRAVPKVNEQQIKTGSAWTMSEEGETVLLGETQGTWRYYLEGRRYEKTSGDYATGWLMIQGSWYFFDEGGYAVTSTWMDWDGSRYFLNEDGSARTGWMEWEGYWYYFDQGGRILTGWIYGENPTERYYLNPDGTMARDTVVDGYRLDSSGLAHEE